MRKFKENSKLEKRKYRSRLPRKEKKELQKANKRLIEQYPFLLPRNVWTGKVPKDYNYLWTRADEFPDGWWNRFGFALCEDLKDVLIRNNYLDKFRIAQIKEKYGTLCLYDFGSPAEWEEHMVAWEYISEYTCINCGAFPASMRDDGWISPYCDRCFKKMHFHATPKEIEYMTSGNDQIEEYCTYYVWKNNEKTEIKIDMKPYYKLIGYDWLKEH